MSSLSVMRRGSWPVVAVFVCIIALQVFIAVASIDVLSSVRAYVTGESLYSKGQKDAQIHLLDYAEFHREQDYQRFLAALAVPLGDRAAREELQKAQPSPERARQGFLDGGNHPDDIDGLIRLFQWFHRLRFMADAIDTWTAGDSVIEQMRSIAERARERINAGDIDAAAVREMRTQAPILNARLTRLEREFSDKLGEASRLTQRLLLGLNLSLAVLLALTGLGFVRYSARRQASADAEVRRRGESLQRLLDSTAEGLFGVDTEGRCIFINRAALRMLRYQDESELLGRDIYALIHPSRADGSPCLPGEARPGPARGEQQEVHVANDKLWRSDGSSFPAEYWSHPVMRDGQVDGAVATFFDIGERLRMQVAVREGELRMARLVDAVADGVITMDANERIVLFNRSAEKLFGVSAAEAIGTSIRRFIPPLRNARPGQNLRSMMDEAAGHLPGTVSELVGMRATGSVFPLEASLSRLDTERESLTTVVFRDVTELAAARAERQAREASEASSQAKTEFLSRMSHELRTPLNAVLGFAQLLRQDSLQAPTPVQLERIRHIEQAGAHLLALVNDILDLSRVESGQMSVASEPVSLPSVVDEALGMVTALAAGARVELLPLRIETPPDPASSAAPQVMHVLADRVRLLQVLVNLLSNAVKYNRVGGSVRVDAVVDAGQCHLAVTDTGQGMTPEKLAHLFEPFNRLGAETSRVEGTGIGLVLSRRLMALMGGELTVDSVAHQGTVATLRIPLSAVPLEPAAAAAGTPPRLTGPVTATHRSRPLNVLYAEDNPVNAELMRQLLSQRPSVVLRIAENGTAALAMAQLDVPDLMLVDMNLGDMTGLELAQALRRHPSTQQVRLVALSADALPGQIDAALAVGFEDYLTKPIDVEALLGMLDGVAV